jgi:hypothetical protein
VKTLAEITQTIHVSFDSHHVAVESGVDEVIEAFATAVSPMIALEAKGRPAGSFQVAHTNGSIVVRGSDGPDECFADGRLAVRGLYHRSIKALIDARPDLLWLHAGVAGFGEHAVLLSAPSCQGKSTLVAELLQWGCTYMSDDVAPIDPTNSTVLPFPVMPYKRVSAQPDLPLEAVARLGKESVEMLPHMIGVVPRSISEIYFLRYQSRGPRARITECSAGAAVVELLRNSFGADSARNAEIQRLCRLVEQVECTYLDYSDAQDAARCIVSAAARRLPVEIESNAIRFR